MPKKPIRTAPWQDRYPHVDEIIRRLGRTVPPRTPSLAEAQAWVQALHERSTGGLERVAALVDVARASLAAGQPGAAIAPLDAAMRCLIALEQSGNVPSWRRCWIAVGMVFAQIQAADGMVGTKIVQPPQMTPAQLEFFMLPLQILARYGVIKLAETILLQAQRIKAPFFQLDELIEGLATQDLPDADDVLYIHGHVAKLERMVHELVEYAQLASREAAPTS